MLACLASLVFLCSANPAMDKFVKVYLPGNISITAELAVTDEERQQGLMFRDRLNPDQGMLFVFEEEGFYSFWMKNMKFPIDILWLDGEKKIVHIESGVPPCLAEPCPSYGPKFPSLYVFEIISGGVEKYKLKMFDRITFILPPRLNESQNPLS